MRLISLVGALAAVCALASSAAGHHKYDAGDMPCACQHTIPWLQGQACSMPASFSPAPLCCDPHCYCCDHVWDGYCGEKQRCRAMLCRPVSGPCNCTPTPAAGCQSR